LVDPALHQVDREKDKAVLDQAAKVHLRKMVHQLVQRSLIIKRSDKRQWAEVVIGLAENACKSVMPQVKLGDMMDIRPYVNVKAIPGGHITESAYVTGVVARKQVAHKKMRREIKEPRVMLLSGSLQFQRVEHQMTSLDTLIEQERKYLEILVPA
jgi:1-phosphatidylinositol-3-phosphate 5-kinase